MVMEVVQEDMGEGSMVCTDHPYKSTIPAGGICAFCLQEKLGKLVSSSFPSSIFPSTSSSPSPSFRSDFGGGTSSATSATATSALSLSLPKHTSHQEFQNPHHTSYSKRSRVPFLLTGLKSKNKADVEKNMVFQRSKSTATVPRRRVGLTADDYSPRRRWFWSFLYLNRHVGSTSRRIEENRNGNRPVSVGASSLRQRSARERTKVDEVTEQGESPDDETIERKVSRSRSVGCGSRSFSGDFFERISTGFGDCTLRRVESQREGKPKTAPINHPHGGGGDCITERVKCGRIFGGFMVASSSSSSSSSSYWVSSSTDDGRAPPSTAATGHLAHGRIKSWGWAFASPIRAFSKPQKRENARKSKAAPNLNAVPSLLAVGG